MIVFDSRDFHLVRFTITLLKHLHTEAYQEHGIHMDSILSEACAEESAIHRAMGRRLAQLQIYRVIATFTTTEYQRTASYSPAARGSS